MDSGWRLLVMEVSQLSAVRLSASVLINHLLVFPLGCSLASTRTGIHLAEPPKQYPALALLNKETRRPYRAATSILRPARAIQGGLHAL